MKPRKRPLTTTAMITVWTLLYLGVPAFGQSPLNLPPMAPLTPPLQRPVDLGPYNAEFIAGGDGLAERVPGYGDTEKLALGSVWTLSVWVKPMRPSEGPALVSALGMLGTPDVRGVFIDGQKMGVQVGDKRLTGTAALKLGQWNFVAAVSDGQTVRLFVNGAEAGQDAIVDATRPDPVVDLGPRIPGQAVFTGKLAGLAVTAHALSSDQLAALAATPLNEDLIQFATGAPKWPISLRQQAGLYQPQPAWTLPKGKGGFSPPVAKPVADLPIVSSDGNGRYTLNGWRLIEGPKVAAGGAALSRPGVDTATWYRATVPGTVLTTLVDRGVYPDPTIGLNNMAIPEKLNKQDYWYRTEFTAPADLAGRHLSLNLNGVNYAADVWLNGKPLGSVTGAFIRGAFDVTGLMTPGQVNVVAVRIAPPPHPGIPAEQSLTDGRGDNGGAMTMDGPSFVAAEGWDWIPGIRDRNMGLWQGVDLQSTGDVKIGDSQFVTTLPDARTARLEIDVPVSNLSDHDVTTTVRVAFDDVTVETAVTVAAHGATRVRFDPSAFPQLVIHDPKLWWPNGYGAPNLHQATITTRLGSQVSDTRPVRFGMREVTYEISLLDHNGDLRRVGLDTTKARELGQSLVDETHEHIRKVPGGWAASLRPEAETSPAVQAIAGDSGLAPHLLIKVNGVRIAARGGNIGMDDLMKRVERSRLEPFFRLQRDAHLNVIRNWVGQNTEDTFFDLADEYGLMVLNDFWESTTNSNVEPDDLPLFMSNATDTVRRFRNHPSIVLWFGRNEGVPQPALNTALQGLIEQEDGTRLYMGASNMVNLAPSGPYNWREPAGYFGEYARGFAVEIGTPSFPTLEAWKRAVPEPDLWPINDTWAYHDWHPDRNGSVVTFMAAMDTRFGAATGLEDFESKAQMLEYESYRAIFEGFNAGLWTVNTGRMLWMTQPAWPSSHWQLFSSDYDTHAAYYGTQKASEPVHVQMNLPDFKVILVNNLTQPAFGVTVRARILGLDGHLVSDRKVSLNAAAGQPVDAFTLDLASAMQAGPVLVHLEGRGKGGALLSDNVYWQAKTPADLKALDALAPVTVSAKASTQKGVSDDLVTVTLRNPSRVPALAIKLTLFDGDGKQTLPAYFSDNYISLMPGDGRTVTIAVPHGAEMQGTGAHEVRLRGWNLVKASVTVP